MKERPILFNGETVRAILAGRKTQTRRVIYNPKRLEGLMVAGEEAEWSPFGRPGDRLWVKEGVWSYDMLPVGRNKQFLWPKFTDEQKARRWFDSACCYTADLTEQTWPLGGDGGRLNKCFMPRWASRIDLEVLAVRAERVQEASTSDIVAEGRQYEQQSIMAGLHYDRIMHDQFHSLWDSLYAKKGLGWNVNPWVWVVEFTQAERTK